MKIEFLHHWHARHGISAKSRLTAYLPRYAPAASRFAPLINLRNSSPALAKVAEKLTGMSAKRKLPAWRRDIYRPGPTKQAGKDVVLFVDCFSRYFEPENARAARRVLEAAGYSVVEDASSRPLCCGRTFLSAGLVDEARVELTRLVYALGAEAERGVPIVGIEPSCLLTLRDELGAVVKKGPIQAIAKQSLLFEEFLARESRRGELKLALRANGPRKAYLHGHCHQKALGTMPDVLRAIGRGDRIELLWNGRRLRVRGGALRRLDADGGAQLTAGGAQRTGRRLGPGRRDQLPPSDRGRRPEGRRARGTDLRGDAAVLIYWSCFFSAFCASFASFLFLWCW